MAYVQQPRGQHQPRAEKLIREEIQTKITDVTHCLLLASLSRFGLQIDLAIPLFSGSNLGVQLELETLLLKRSLELLAR